MSFEILRTEEFSRHFKQLAKKFPSIKADYASLLKSLESDPLQGTSLGKDCYKIRMRITSKNTGKSGGARVITYVKILKKRVTLLDIYDKSEKDSLTAKELMALLKRAE